MEITPELMKMVNDFKQLPDYKKYPLPDMYYNIKEFGFVKESPPLDVVPVEIAQSEYTKIVDKVDNQILEDIKEIYKPKLDVIVEDSMPENPVVLLPVFSDELNHKHTSLDLRKN